MIIKTKEKLELEEKLKTATGEEAERIKRKLDGMYICNCKHIFIESDASSRGAYGADERWTKYDCVNCGLTNGYSYIDEFDDEVTAEWLKIRNCASVIISDEGFCMSYIKELYERALNDAEDEFNREEVAYLLKKYIMTARKNMDDVDALKQRKKDIELIDKKLKELSKLPVKDLNDIKFNYYVEYFNLHRREYSLLEDIPPYEYFKYKQNAVHPLSEYSNLNIVLLGQFIVELFKKYEKKYMQTFIRFKDHKINENKTVEVPNVVIGVNPDRKNFETKNNIVIPFNKNYDIFHKDDYIDSYVRYSSYDQTDAMVCFSPKRQLIGYNQELDDFDCKGHEFIRDLIYTLAYYQKEMGVKDVDKEYLNKVFKRIYSL